MMQSAFAERFVGAFHSARESESGRHLDDAETPSLARRLERHSDLDEQPATRSARTVVRTGFTPVNFCS